MSTKKLKIQEKLKKKLKNNCVWVADSNLQSQGYEPCVLSFDHLA